MESKLWKYSAVRDVPAGKVLVVGEDVFIAAYVIEGGGRLALRLSGDSAGGSKLFHTEPCVFFTGEIEFDVSADALLHLPGGELQRSGLLRLQIREDGAYVTGKLGAEARGADFAVSSQGNVLGTVDMLNDFRAVATWTLTLIESNGVRTPFITVEARPAP